MNRIIRSLLVCLLFFATTLAVADELQHKQAEKKMELAFSQCEYALQVSLPQSPVSLRVLARYIKKYHNYRKAALAISPELLKSTHTYSSNIEREHDEKMLLIQDKSYAEMDDLCQSSLDKKLKQATASVQKKQSLYQQHHQVDETTQNQARAKFQASIAINRYCGRYILPPTIYTPEKVQKQLDSDYQFYQTAKQKAEELGAAVLQESLNGLLFKDKKSQHVTQDIKTWFAYCDTVFPNYIAALNALRLVDRTEEVSGLDESNPTAETLQAQDMGDASDVIPSETTDASPTAQTEKEAAPVDASVQTAPTALTEPSLGEQKPETSEMPNTPADTENIQADAEQDDYFQALLAQVAHDKRTVLESHQREPDISNNEDYPEKATIWHYENDEGTECTTYQFKGNQLLKKQVKKKACM